MFFVFFCSQLENLACGLLSQAHLVSTSNAIKLIQRPLYRWGRLKCMELAKLARDLVLYCWCFFYYLILYYQIQSNNIHIITVNKSMTLKFRHVP